MAGGTVVIELEANSTVSVILYNSLGQEVSTLENANLGSGNHTYELNVSGKGIYFLHTIINGIPAVHKLIQVD